MELNPICKCPICGRVYQAFAMMVGDQSVCGYCRRAAQRGADAPDTEEQKRRRRNAYGDY